MGTHKMPPDCEVVPPINGLLSTSITVKPCACPAIAAAQPPAPDPMQIQSTVEDHVLACIRLSSHPNVPDVVRGVAGDENAELFQKMLWQFASLGTTQPPDLPIDEPVAAGRAGVQD